MITVDEFDLITQILTTVHHGTKELAEQLIKDLDIVLDPDDFDSYESWCAELRIQMEKRLEVLRNEKNKAV